MDVITLITYILPPIIAALGAWLLPQPKKLRKNPFETLSDPHLWQPILERLAKEYSTPTMKIIIEAVEYAMNFKKGASKQKNAVKKATQNLKTAGLQVSQPILNTLIEVALEHIKQKDASPPA